MRRHVAHLPRCSVDDQLGSHRGSRGVGAFGRAAGAALAGGLSLVAADRLGTHRALAAAYRSCGCSATAAGEALLTRPFRRQTVALAAACWVGIVTSRSHCVWAMRLLKTSQSTASQHVSHRKGWVGMPCMLPCCCCMSRVASAWVDLF